MIKSQFSSISVKDVECTTARQECLLGGEQELAVAIANRAARARFIAGRMAARMALGGLGWNERLPIERTVTGSPCWPKGFVGSISHCSDIAVAVAAAAVSGYRAIGCDVERADRKVRARLIDRIAVPSERDWITAESDGTTQRVLVVFSAKEALYKAASALGAPVFWFKEAALDCQEELSTGWYFRASISKEIADRCGASNPLSVEVHRYHGHLLSICCIR